MVSITVKGRKTEETLLKIVYTFLLCLSDVLLNLEFDQIYFESKASVNIYKHSNLTFSRDNYLNGIKISNIWKCVKTVLLKLI